MLKAIIREPLKLKVIETEKPEAGKGEALIALKNIGVCGSDLHVYHGVHPCTYYPITTGHEISGVVEKLGEGVTGLKIGQPVTVMPQLFCGKCLPCRSGMYNICNELKVHGFQTEGVAAEWFAFPADMVMPLPDGLSFEEGAMMEPLAVACHAIGRFGDVKGRKVAVLGAGTIGNLVAQAALGMGAGTVLISDVSDFRLRIAEECGIPFRTNSTREPFAEAYAAAFGPDGADVMFECAGAQQTLDDMLACARKGSAVVIVAMYGKRPEVEMSHIQEHELTVIGTLMYRREDFVSAIGLLGGNKVQLARLITHRFPFRDYEQAYKKAAASKDDAMKVMIGV
ncbi:MAG: alcohol dehydrogenase catalytic domain-containing protein [Planctomycetota bacterium]|jgi:L-iditol 2-dehydrogenase|nr:alcohol dehydrogenase catalytic domain-containing protein [Planctomycetota bacterium]